MRTALFLVLIAAVGCQSDLLRAHGAERVELAVITGNSLPADGCEEFVRLDTGNLTGTPTRYKPTPSSLSILQKALAAMTPAQRYQGERPIRLRFYETGRQVYIQCGWGSRLDVAEIEILDITER